MPAKNSSLSYPWTKALGHALHFFESPGKSTDNTKDWAMTNIKRPKGVGALKIFLVVVKISLKTVA